MRINYANNTIELTKAEAKAAGVYGSEEYKKIIEIKKDLSNFNIVVITSAPRKANRSIDHLKGLTFRFMEAYIKAHGTTEQEEELKTYLAHEKDGLQVKSKGYGKVRKWFLAQFPEIETYREKISSSIETAEPLRETA